MNRCIIVNINTIFYNLIKYFIKNIGSVQFVDTNSDMPEPIAAESKFFPGRMGRDEALVYYKALANYVGGIEGAKAQFGAMNNQNKRSLDDNILEGAIQSLNNMFITSAAVVGREFGIDSQKVNLAKDMFYATLYPEKRQELIKNIFNIIKPSNETTGLVI